MNDDIELVKLITSEGRVEMGYYSEVALVLRKSAKELLDKKLDEISEKAAQARELLSEANTKKYVEDGDDSAYLWHWNGVKWEEDYYDDVKFIMDFLDSLPASDYKIIRNGEDYDDPIEEWGDFYDSPFMLSVTRAISISEVPM